MQDQYSEEMNLSSLTEEEKNRVVYLRDEELLDDPYNDKFFATDPDDGLVQSMKEYGFQGVILAYPVEGGKYMIESGHRRRLAAKKAGLDSFRVFVTQPPASLTERKIRLITSNLHNRKQTPFRTAKIAKALIETRQEIMSNQQFPVNPTQIKEQVATDLDIIRKDLDRLLVLLELDPGLQALSNSELYSWREISNASSLDPDRQALLYNHICHEEENNPGEPVTREFIKQEIKRLKTISDDEVQQELNPSENEGQESEPVTNIVSHKRPSFTYKSAMKEADRLNVFVHANVICEEEQIPELLDKFREIQKALSEKIEDLSERHKNYTSVLGKKTVGENESLENSLNSFLANLEE